MNVTILSSDNFFYFCASTASPPACVTAETQVMTAELNGVSVNQLQPGDAILAATGDITTVSYISKHVVAAHTPVYQINNNGPYITAQHPVELVGSNIHCEHTFGMIDAAGWISKSTDYMYGCVVELSAGHTIIQYIGGVATYVTVESIDQYALSDVSSETVVYNVYTTAGHNIIADGIVLGEPSKIHMKQQYNDVSAINVYSDVTINSVDMIVPINKSQHCQYCYQCTKLNKSNQYTSPYVNKIIFHYNSFSDYFLSSSFLCVHNSFISFHSISAASILHHTIYYHTMFSFKQCPIYFVSWCMECAVLQQMYCISRLQTVGINIFNACV